MPRTKTAVKRRAKSQKREAVSSGKRGRRTAAPVKLPVEQKRRGPRANPEYDYNAKQAELMSKKRAKARDLVIPEVKNLARRQRCKGNPGKFMLTYFPHRCYLPFSELHKEIIAEFHHRIRYGGRGALAAPRGFGKDAMCVMLVLWALLYGRLRYVVLIAINLTMSLEMMEEVKMELETNELLVEDFPEVCVPVRALERQAARSRSQTVAGKFTRMIWGSDDGGIRLPEIEGSASSGAKLVARGIESGIRGLTKDGERPDFVILTDIETDEGAASETVRKKNEKVIDKAIGALAGPGRVLRAFLLCTIICPECLAETYTDPALKPAWNGRRQKALEEMPDRMDLWEEYITTRRDGKETGSDPDGRGAHKFYLKHRKEMDRGAKVAWKENFAKHKMADGSQCEVSAIQRLMNIIADDGEATFFSEYQNAPVREDDQIGLTKDLVMSRLNGYPEGVVPEACVRVVESLDVRARELHYNVKGYAQDGTAFTIDYGIIPVRAQSGEYLTQSAETQKALEAAILAALRFRRDEIRLQDGYPRADGDTRVQIDLHLVDSGWLPDVVYRFTKESGRRWRACKGDGSGQHMRRYTPPKPGAEGTRLGKHYYGSILKDKAVVLWHLDADHWKEHVHLRYLQPPETEGAWTLWGMDPKNHRLFASHVVAEVFNEEKNKWEKVKKHNHFFDTEHMNAAGAAMLGIHVLKKVRLQARDGQPEGVDEAPPVPAKRKPKRRLPMAADSIHDVRNPQGRRLPAPAGEYGRRRGGLKRW